MTAPRFCARGVLAFETERGTRIYRRNKLAAGMTRQRRRLPITPEMARHGSEALRLSVWGTLDPLHIWLGLHTTRRAVPCPCCKQLTYRRVLSDAGRRRLVRLRDATS